MNPKRIEKPKKWMIWFYSPTRILSFHYKYSYNEKMVTKWFLKFRPDATIIRIDLLKK